MNTGTYKFIADVFNLPSDQTFSKYDTLDGQSKEGMLYETLQQMEDEFKQRLKTIYCINPWYGVWLRLGVLNINEMKVKEKLVFNPYTMQLVGFVGCVE